MTAQIWGRAEAISRLRAHLVESVDPENSLCRVAAEKGIFCRGFRRWNDAEFDRRWRGFIGRSTHLSRPQMEEYANLWQLAEQAAKHASRMRRRDGRAGTMPRLERIFERSRRAVLQRPSRNQRRSGRVGDR